MARCRSSWSTISVLLAVLAPGCSQGLGDPPDGGGGPGADGGGGGGDDIDPCGAPCTDPPPARCTSACESSAPTGAGTCDGTACQYPSEVEACPRGCDEANGRCRGDSEQIPECAMQACGTRTACGTECQAGSGCCASETYQKSSGYTYSGYQLCCDGSDPTTATSDCGSGHNHWATATAPNCGAAYEGPDNYGAPCVQLTCTRQVCM